MDDEFLSLLGFESVKDNRTIACPCGGTMNVVRSLVYTWRSGERRLIYLCESCGTKHGAHPDGRPLGTPTNDPVLKALRHECHLLLDQLSGTTQQKYNRLSQMMGVREIHIGSLDVSDCRRAADCLRRCISRDSARRVSDDRLRQEARRTEPNVDERHVP